MLDHDNLEDFADPHTYDIRDDSDTGIAFYSALARETGGPVLEIACGTGRVGIPIARLGVAMTGLDIVPAMVELARAKSAGLPARWVAADARAFDLGERFRLIFLTGNAFQLFLTREDQEALLGHVRAHLHDDGLFAFETRNPRWSDRGARAPESNELFALLETCDQEEESRTYTDREGHAVRVSLTQAYDHASQLLHWTARHRRGEGDQEHTRTVRLAVRFTFPQELAALLHYNGFTVEHRYGDWNLEPLSATSPSIIVVCRKRA